MSSDEEKKIWKEDASQLKKDLDSRQKVVKKNEVAIKFGKSVSNKENTSSSKNKLSEKFGDDYLRKSLGL
jgi:hypothetical protein